MLEEASEHFCSILSDCIELCFGETTCTLPIVNESCLSSVESKVRTGENDSLSWKKLDTYNSSVSPDLLAVWWLT